MRARPLGAAVLVAAALAIGGCASPVAEPTAWQVDVETVADQASGGDYGGALASLDALQADVTTRRDAGELSVEEADRILAAIDVVRSDLAALVPAPEPTPDETGSSPEPQTSVTTVDDGSDQVPEQTDDDTDDEAPNQEKSPKEEKAPKEEKPPKEEKAPKEDKGSRGDPSGSSTGPGSGRSGPGKNG